MKRFFYHYNKPLSKQKKKVIWSIHHDKKCHFVEQIVCKVPAESKTNKRQPYAVMQGFCANVLVKKKVAYIV